MTAQERAAGLVQVVPTENGAWLRLNHDGLSLYTGEGAVGCAVRTAHMIRAHFAAALEAHAAEAVQQVLLEGLRDCPVKVTDENLTTLAAYCEKARRSGYPPPPVV